MDGNLLDSENADATLAKEWSLPELPPGTEKVNFMESFYLFIFFLRDSAVFYLMSTNTLQQVTKLGF